MITPLLIVLIILQTDSSAGEQYVRIIRDATPVNLRMGPSTTYELINKACHNEVYKYIASGDDGKWINMNIGDMLHGDSKREGPRDHRR